MSRPAAELVKWWSKASFERGRVIRHLSPFEQRPSDYLIRTIPEKAIRKIKENAFPIVPAFILLWGTVAWGEAENDRYHRTHWS